MLRRGGKKPSTDSFRFRCKGGKKPSTDSTSGAHLTLACIKEIRLAQGNKITKGKETPGSMGKECRKTFHILRVFTLSGKISLYRQED